MANALNKILITALRIILISLAYGIGILLISSFVTISYMIGVNIYLYSMYLLTLR